MNYEERKEKFLKTYQNLKEKLKEKDIQIEALCLQAETTYQLSRIARALEKRN